MNNYKILVQDNQPNQTNPIRQYNAEVFAKDTQTAIKEITEFYTQELNTDQNSIQILSIIKL